MIVHKVIIVIQQPFRTLRAQNVQLAITVLKAQSIHYHVLLVRIQVILAKLTLTPAQCARMDSTAQWQHLNRLNVKTVKHVLDLVLHLFHVQEVSIVTRKLGIKKSHVL